MFACRICGQPTNEFLDLGEQPAANQFKENLLDPEEKYRLKAVFCPSCYSIQIKDFPDVKNVYNETYPFLTSSSNYMVKHFKNLADLIKQRCLPEYKQVMPGGIRRPSDNGFVLEIGSNDGTFLKNFNNILHLGIEPSYNIAQKSGENGVLFWDRFFDEHVAEDVITTFGHPYVIVSTNVFGHIPQRNSVLKGIRWLLKPEGVWINEEAYIGNILERVSYDQFYNEHIFYSSIISFRNVLDKHDLEIIDVEFYNVHGGSIRYFVGRKGEHSSNKSKIDYLIGVENLNTFDRLKLFASQVERSKHRLLSQIHLIKSWGGRVVGYGATAKSTTILNYCGIDSSLIDQIYDTTPSKQWKFSPGTGIQIVPYYKKFEYDRPENVVLFAWNHAAEIYDKEKDHSINWIIPIGI